MGLCVYPLFNLEVPEAKSKTTGEFLAKEFQTLDNIADSHGFQRLTAYADNRQGPDWFTGPPEDLDEILGPSQAWFDPAKGRETFQSLSELIKLSPQAALKLQTPDEVVGELEDLSRMLAIASTKGAWFRLEIN